MESVSDSPQNSWGNWDVHPHQWNRVSLVGRVDGPWMAWRSIRAKPKHL